MPVLVGKPPKAARQHREAFAVLACDRLCDTGCPVRLPPGYHDPGFGPGVPAADPASVIYR